MTTHSRTGFTLPELIGVFVLILVIAAILFPVYQQEQGGHKIRRRSACMSNLKQLGLGLTQYAQDSDEVLPSGVNAAGNGWAGAIYPFIKNTSVYHCPSDPLKEPYISYAENQNIVKQKLMDFTNPTDTIAFYETSTLNCDPSSPETVSATGISAPQNSTRHDSNFGLCFAALDGHVKYLTPAQVSGGHQAVPVGRLSAGKYVETFAAK